MGSTRRYTAQLVDSDLHCKSAENEKRIALANVLCALPQSSEEGSGFILLFIQACAGADSQREYERLESIWAADLPSTVLSERLCTGIPHHLDPERGVEIHIILSRGSGMGLAHDNFRNLVQPFLSFLKVTGYKVHETRSAQSITELARSDFLYRARTGGPQTIILLSGDGGLVDIVDVFYNADDAKDGLRTPPNIALIPSGTGNAMANSIGLLDQPINGLTALLRGKGTPIPVFRATFSPGSQYITAEGNTKTPISQHGHQDNPTIYGAVVASWGMHAALVADSDTTEYRKFGSDRFKMAAKELLFPSTGEETHKYRGIITLTLRDPKNGEPRTTEVVQGDEHAYILATFVPKLEKGFVISPDSKALDGRLRIVHFSPMPPNEAVELMSLAYQNGKHAHHRDVTYTEVEGFEIKFREELEKWRRVCIDGKIIVVPRDGWMDVQRERRHLLELISL